MDAGERETRKGFLRTRRELNRIYGQAQQELQQKVKEYADKYAKEDAKMREKLLNGEITPEEYAKWQRSKVWRGQQWQDKLDSVTRVLADANSEALKIVNGQRIGVFAQNASYQNFCADQAGIGGLWDIYDEATVARLLEENPELLPPKKLIRSKDVIWNRRNVNNCITQGILQGESILDIAKRIAEETGNKNGSQMLRTARTAMTSAQNAGRIEAMREQMNMGIRVKKKWIATLDKHTRDAHQDLDGDVVDVDEPFESKLGEIKFPGDPEAKPANVYNCRCCLGYEYPDFPQQNNTRRDNETNEVIEYQTYKEWKKSRKEMGLIRHSLLLQTQNSDIMGMGARAIIHAKGIDGKGTLLHPTTETVQNCETPEEIAALFMRAGEDGEMHTVIDETFSEFPLATQKEVAEGMLWAMREFGIKTLPKTITRKKLESNVLGEYIEETQSIRYRLGLTRADAFPTGVHEMIHHLQNVSGVSNETIVKNALKNLRITKVSKAFKNDGYMLARDEYTNPNELIAYSVAACSVGSKNKLALEIVKQLREVIKK